MEWFAVAALIVAIWTALDEPVREWWMQRQVRA